MEEISTLYIENREYLAYAIILFIPFFLKKARLYIWNPFEKSVIKSYYGKIITNKLISIFRRDSSTYYTLASKYHQKMYIGGLKEQFPYAKLNEIFIDIKCGIVNDHILGDSSLVDGLIDLPISNQMNILDCIHSSENLSSTTLLLGGPGSGKTTIINHLLEELLKKKNKKLIPVPLIVRELTKFIVKMEDKNFSLNNLITIYFKENVIENDEEFLPEKWLLRNLKNGNCLILIDGVDELESDKSRLIFIDWLSNELRRNKNNKFLITSRQHGIEGHSFGSVNTRYLCPLSSNNVEGFIKKWYDIIASEEMKEIKSKSINSNNSIKKKNNRIARGLTERILTTRSLRVLSRKPMILTMMLIVHNTGNMLPERRCALFDRVMMVMLGGRNLSKGITQKIQPEQKQSLLAVIAHHMTITGRVTLSLTEIECIFKGHSGNFSTPYTVKEFLYEVVKNSGLIVSPRANEYGFCHKSFREYLTSRYIQEKNDDFPTSKILSLVNQQGWKEVLLLYVGQIDASNIITEIIKHKYSRLLSFFIAVLEEALSIDSKVKKNADIYIESLIESRNVKDQLLIGRAFLKKRLKSLIIDDEVIFDSKPITYIEFQYFLWATTNNFKRCNFFISNPEIALSPIRDISKLQASRFCTWITLFMSDGWTYRLPFISDNLPKEEIHKSRIWSNNLKLADAINVYGSYFVENLYRTRINLVKRYIINDAMVSNDMIFRLHSIYKVPGNSCSKERSDELQKQFLELFVTCPDLNRFKDKTSYFIFKVSSLFLDASNYSQLLTQLGFFNNKSVEKHINLTFSTAELIDRKAKSFNLDIKNVIKNEIFNLISSHKIEDCFEQLNLILGKSGIRIYESFQSDFQSSSIDFNDSNNCTKKNDNISLVRIVLLSLYLDSEYKREKFNYLVLYTSLCMLQCSIEDKELYNPNFNLHLVKDAIQSESKLAGKHIRSIYVPDQNLLEELHD